MKELSRGRSEVQAMRSVSSTSWHVRALVYGGGIRVALTNFLPRRVPRTQAEPALAFPAVTSLPGPPRSRGCTRRGL